MRLRVVTSDESRFVLKLESKSLSYDELKALIVAKYLELEKHVRLLEPVPSLRSNCSAWLGG